MKPKEWIKEVLTNSGGVQGYAREVNKLLIEWLTEAGKELKHINFFSVDFITPELAKVIIQINEL